MDADLGEVEQPVEQPDVPIGGAARADMAEHTTVLARQVFGADGGDRAGAHVGDARGVEQRARHAGRGIEQRQQADLRGQVLLVIVHVVADDLHPREVDRAADGAAQHVEMAVHRRVGDEVHPRLDDRLAAALGGEAGFDRCQDVVVAERQRRDVETVEIGDVDRLHHDAPSSIGRRSPCSRAQSMANS